MTSNNHLMLTIAKPATVWFDLVSLFPPTYHGRTHGNRIDMMDKLAAMHPKFLRLPGGNYLEGDHIADRFDWKKTIGPWVDRPTHESPWRYRSSDGMGLLEFLEWCEDLKMQPVLAVYAGYSLAQEHVDPGPALEPYVQDALDEIEYVTGGADTKWGAERVKDGHAAPFPLHYVEIGNEDEFDRSGSYDGRYAQFYKAIKQRYPQLADDCHRADQEHEAGCAGRALLHVGGGVVLRGAPLRQHGSQRAEDLCGRMGDARRRSDAEP